MIKLGILKSHGGKSSSKPMHSAALNNLGIEGEYTVYECLPEDLKKTFDELRKNKVRGVNVTIPHKIPVMSLVDKISERAKLIGAVNTIIFEEDGKSTGENTDMHGFWNAIPKEIREQANGKDVALLGAGGAACACAVAFIQNEVKTLKIYARDMNKLKAFKTELESKNLKSQTKIEIDLLENIDLSNTFILTNTTPVGMYPNSDSSPVKLEDLKKLPKGGLVYDIVYNPFETVLLKDAKSLGYKTLNGVEMLVLQGAESLKMWLKRNDVPVDVMRDAVVKSLLS
jgi:shikimate dehydrogenase